jgi:pimeloyl-ACP methyl ester carboxylesterase
MSNIEHFEIDIAVGVVTDLRERIAKTRWPDNAPGDAWSQGTDLDYVREFLAFWANHFDWTAEQDRLNGFNHFATEIDGISIHFIHERARHGRGIPLLLTHGWPSCFIEYLELVPLLTDPAAYDIDSPPFDVIVPSLPGYGFSQRPHKPGVNYSHVASIWHRLMEDLDYPRFGAHGGDFGSGVSAMMALQRPDRVSGLHLTNIDIGPQSPGDRPWTRAEMDFFDQEERWARTERGYSAIQSTRPQTVGYGLNDSPAGLAAWLLEKWRAWTDSKGDPAAQLSREFLASMLTIYWATESITTSMRDYYDNRWHPVDTGPSARIEVPTAVAVFSQHHVPEPEPPREWVERMYNVQRWTTQPAGGHFAAIEQPRLVAQDLAAFFKTVTARQI